MSFTKSSCPRSEVRARERHLVSSLSDPRVCFLAVEFLTKILEVDRVKVKAQVWDTAGQERYNSMMSTYYRKAKGAVLVYDISDKKSFDAIDRWRTELQDQGDKDLTMMLVGNKSDMDGGRTVSRQEGVSYAAQHEMLFEETSAKVHNWGPACFTGRWISHLVPCLCFRPAQMCRRRSMTSSHVRACSLGCCRAYITVPY
jgi:small GTP-binding protein